VYALSPFFFVANNFRFRFWFLIIYYSIEKDGSKLPNTVSNMGHIILIAQLLLKSFQDFSITVEDKEWEEYVKGQSIFDIKSEIF
jgi:hypothetical protein